MERSPRTAAERLRGIVGSRSSSQFDPETIDLDGRTAALVGIGAAIALNGLRVTYQALTEDALAAGGSDDDVLGAFLAIAPMIGTASIVATTPKLALAIGYDISEALEKPPQEAKRQGRPTSSG